VTQNEVPFPKGRYIVSKTDLKGCITYANDTFITLSGFDREELIGVNHNVVRHPDMPPAAFADLWTSMKEGRPWRGIVKNRCKNGDFYWVDALVVPVRQKGQTIGYMSVRTMPSRAQIQSAEALYAKLNAGGGAIPRPGPWSKVSLGKKMAGLTLFVMLAQLFTGIGVWASLAWWPAGCRLACSAASSGPWIRPMPAWTEWPRATCRKTCGTSVWTRWASCRIPYSPPRPTSR
jgi:aerotaxis receptor